MSRERKLLKQALAALEDESLYREWAEDLVNDISDYFEEHPYPASELDRKSLTDEELQACIPALPKDGVFSLVDGKWGVSTQWVREFAKAIEQALKEQNT